MPATRKVTEDQRQQMIADAAYFRAQRRGFGGGDPVADWLAAEAEVDARLRHADGGLLDGLDERLATVNERLATLRRKVSRMKVDAREEWQHDVEKLGKLRDSLKQRLEEIREHGEHASEKAQQRAEALWAEISEILHRTTSRPRKTSRK